MKRPLASEFELQIFNIDTWNVILRFSFSSKKKQYVKNSSMSNLHLFFFNKLAHDINKRPWVISLTRAAIAIMKSYSRSYIQNTPVSGQYSQIDHSIKRYLNFSPDIFRFNIESPSLSNRKSTICKDSHM